MHIEHVAVWTADLDRLAAFYADVLGGAIGPLYFNPRRGFRSRFVSFDGGARIELMNMPSLGVRGAGENPLGWHHIALALDSPDEVDARTAALRARGVPIVGEPRTTGDGYYESVFLDPDGNRVELVARPASSRAESTAST